MYTDLRYPLRATVKWSRTNFLLPALWAALVTTAYVAFDLEWLAIPWLPMSLIGIAVAFYLGFKNNASYDRTWEARKIWGAIVNASRSWAFSSRDFVTGHWAEEKLAPEAVEAARSELIHRHVAWLDALRFQLRKVKKWEHDGPNARAARTLINVPEFHEELREVLAANLSDDEVEEVLAQLNPAAHLLSHQSRHLRELFEQGYIDSFRQVALQEILVELMAQQGKAERIKNFPFPRQYATVNTYFAWLLVLLLPLGLVREFASLGSDFLSHDLALVLMNVGFTGLVSWVFLTAGQIGDWSENPFEGLHNDVPISAMARGIERDIRQMNGETELPPARPTVQQVLM